MPKKKRHTEVTDPNVTWKVILSMLAEHALVDDLNEALFTNVNKLSTWLTNGGHLPDGVTDANTIHGLLFLVSPLVMEEVK